MNIAAWFRVMRITRYLLLIILPLAQQVPARAQAGENDTQPAGVRLSCTVTNNMDGQPRSVIIDIDYKNKTVGQMPIELTEQSISWGTVSEGNVYRVVINRYTGAIVSTAGNIFGSGQCTPVSNRRF